MTAFNTITALRAVRDMKLDGTQKLVLFAMVSRADEKGECWPSFATLAADTGLSVRCVKNIVPALSKAGLVVVRGSRKAGSSRPESNRYTLTMVHHVHHEKPAKHDGAPDAPSSVDSAPRAPTIVHHVHDHGAPRAQEEIQGRDTFEGGEAPPPDSIKSRLRNSAAAVAWSKGIQAGSGRPCRVPSTADWLEWLGPSGDAHVPELAGDELVQWYRTQGEAYGRAHARDKLTPMGFALDLDEQAKQAALEEVRAKALEGLERRSTRDARPRPEPVHAVMGVAQLLRAVGGP